MRLPDFEEKYVKEIPYQDPKGFKTGMRCDGLAVVAQLLHRNVQRFRGGLVFKAHGRLNRSTLGLREIKKKKKCAWI